MRNLLERMSDATARMDQVICIAGAICDSTLSDPLRDFLEDEDIEVLTKCFGELPNWLLEAFEGGRHELGDAFSEWVVQSGRTGFLIQFATPVMKYHGSGSSFSWGYYNTRWIYADTFEAAVDSGMAWVEERRNAEKAKWQTEQNKAE